MKLTSRTFLAGLAEATAHEYRARGLRSTLTGLGMVARDRLAGHVRLPRAASGPPVGPGVGAAGGGWGALGPRARDESVARVAMTLLGTLNKGGGIEVFDVDQLDAFSSVGDGSQN